MGTHSMQGRVFIERSDAGEQGAPRGPAILPLQVTTCDLPLKPQWELAASQDLDSHESQLAQPTRTVWHERQVRAFGHHGQRQLGQLRIGIVGLGGLGATLALNLARLGVRHFTLIDPDCAEWTNLNRVAGMTAIDAVTRNPKVAMAHKRILEIDPSIEVHAHFDDIFALDSWKRLRSCDLILASTDNHSTRLFLNALAQQYLIPLVSIGTLIRSEAGRFEGAFGHVFIKLPGDGLPCLLCSNVIDKTAAYYELSGAEARRAALQYGYIENLDEPTPSVCHLNGVLANLALTEIHNLVGGFMPVHHHLFYQMQEQEIIKIQHEPTSCSVCAPDGQIFGRGDQIDLIDSLFPNLQHRFVTGS